MYILLQLVVYSMFRTCWLDLSCSQALGGLSTEANVEALKEQILALGWTGEENGTSGQNGDVMDTESAVVRDNKDVGVITVSIPRFNIRLTVSIVLEFYIQIIHFEPATPRQLWRIYDVIVWDDTTSQICQNERSKCN
jgi:hypothetical protein